jgi:hypothetical protein
MPIIISTDVNRETLRHPTERQVTVQITLTADELAQQFSDANAEEQALILTKIAELFGAFPGIASGIFQRDNIGFELKRNGAAHNWLRGIAAAIENGEG